MYYLNAFNMYITGGSSIFSAPYYITSGK